MSLPDDLIPVPESQVVTPDNEPEKSVIPPFIVNIFDDLDEDNLPGSVPLKPENGKSKRRLPTFQ